MNGYLAANDAELDKYPDVFGVRYKRYIAAVKEACKQYLTNNGVN